MKQSDRRHSDMPNNLRHAFLDYEFLYYIFIGLILLIHQERLARRAVRMTVALGHLYVIVIIVSGVIMAETRQERAALGITGIVTKLDHW